MKAIRYKRNLLLRSLIVLFLLIVFPVTDWKEEKHGRVLAVTLDSRNEPQFIKKGELSFFDKDRRKIVTIDIEIPETPGEMAAGLMYRRAMAEKRGMLFIHHIRKSSYFWMKNTYIPLDMIFADKRMHIIKIRKNTTPLSEELIPVPDNTIYTIEVNAGFCDRHDIGIGDTIIIQSLKPQQ
jgi:uncharacterized protein